MRGALSSYLAMTQSALDRILRDIDKGSNSPDEEFYGAKFGISIQVRKLETSRHQIFRINLSSLFLSIGKLSLWTNFVIGSDDELTSILGKNFSINAVTPI